METFPISPVSFIRLEKSAKPPVDQTASGQSFEHVLGKALDQVNVLQMNSVELDGKLASGGLEYIHQAMVASEKANLALQLTLQFRNRAIEAYQEIMRTQV